MHFQFYLIAILLSITYVSSKKSAKGLDGAGLEMMLAAIGGLGGDGGGSGSSSASAEESEDSEMDTREVKKYFDSMAKMEEKLYKKEIRHQISKEEQDQLKYFEGMLEKVKKLNGRLCITIIFCIFYNQSKNIVKKKYLA
ncbi:hypothetical protein B5X24_HaOG206456 [Helicoverpa armigera]|uniref:Uncharacterized protein n=1 Tax=Helicoverpa armigera TaxID=29058 RepID=A0A2W1BPS4_HELAM|nr:hypothetical protein B5X24_HaOG206456 [Helicoverpa armigera]